jgi:hypothetical protein
LAILPETIGRKEPLHLVDSTGLKIYGEGEWLDQKRGIRSPRRWRKLHLGVDADTHAIVAAELTPDNIGDVSEFPDLLDQIDIRHDLWRRHRRAGRHSPSAVSWATGTEASGARGVGRPRYLMSFELALLYGRLCDLPGCAASANP